MEKKELIYSIYYTPSKNPMTHNDLNYVCSDNRIHIRFRDFNKEQIIGGFEKKLTYLITYLMNYSYLPSIIGKYDTKTLIKNFLKTDDIQHLVSAIAVYNGLHKFKGLKLTANYRKKECLPFGDVDKNCFPLNSQDGIIAVGSLKEFLEKLRIDLIEYLFNDSYFIILRENKEKAINNKFINKQAKKLERTRDPNLELVELW